MNREPSSFRDPSGYLYWKDNEIFRCILKEYRNQFETATNSKLLEICLDKGLLLPFEKLENSFDCSDCVAVIKPQQIPFFNYPYEWGFDQLKDAALVTLDLHLLALDFGMLLKDASAYNIQFVEGKPVLIDHLSFDFISDYKAWPAYAQFCRHFLAPLALMSYLDLRLNRLSQLYIDGIPLDLASRLLPTRSYFNFGIFIHLHLHSRFTLRHGDTKENAQTKNLSVAQFKAFASSLRSAVSNLSAPKQKTEWGSYYADTNYSEDGFSSKEDSVKEFIEKIRPTTVWDVGGNDGRFSRTLSEKVKEVVCLDIDLNAIQNNYKICKQRGLKNVTPLFFDCANPPPSIGFCNKERPSLLKRGKPDLVVALALIHHIAISQNVPLDDIAQMFAEIAPYLIIEFVPKEDSQVKRLLKNRKDIFSKYTEEDFRKSFSLFFEIENERKVSDSFRKIFLMRRNTNQKNI